MGHTAGMHTESRDAAIKYGQQMPAARVVINSPTTHGAIGFSTDLDPSMTLGCGSWGGNVTSDNVSPIHLMDIKRVAFETKPVNKKVKAHVADSQTTGASTHPKEPIKREQIAAIVDQFLSKKITEAPPQPVVPVVEHATESPVKTVIHELRPQSLTENGTNVSPMDFVSETDVRSAIENGEKIYITAKTILTPSARDLGEEKDIFARV
jgi:acetaldehyde dehydrogenase (acetylating)